MRQDTFASRYVIAGVPTVVNGRAVVARSGGNETDRVFVEGVSDEYFEVVDGLRENETIVAGTYQAIRDLKDGDKVRQADTTRTETAES